MNATAKSGSSPDEHPAIIEMVPVGATVVTLQLRSICFGRMRCPSALRAAVSSGPQMLLGHSLYGPRSPASRSFYFFASSLTNYITLRLYETPSGVLFALP